MTEVQINILIYASIQQWHFILIQLYILSLFFLFHSSIYLHL